MSHKDEVITPKILTKALQYAYANTEYKGIRKDLSYDEAFDKALSWCNFMGFNNYALDIRFTKEERKELRELDKLNIMATEGQLHYIKQINPITKKKSTKEWRTYYWMYNTKNILDFAEKHDLESQLLEAEEQVSTTKEEYSCYDNIPDALWRTSR